MVKSCKTVIVKLELKSPDKDHNVCICLITRTRQEKLLQSEADVHWTGMGPGVHYCSVDVQENFYCLNISIDLWTANVRVIPQLHCKMN